MSSHWISSLADIFDSILFVDEIEFNTPRHRLSPVNEFLFSYRYDLR